MGTLDLLVIHPGAAHGIYGVLGDDLVALEPPLWARLIAGYVRDRGHSVKILDAEADRQGPHEVGQIVRDLRPRLVCIAVYGHQPSASTQQMHGAGLTARAIKAQCDVPIIMVGGHVAALPERTLREEAIDFACYGEGPMTVDGLLRVMRGIYPEVSAMRDIEPTVPSLADVRDLLWRKDGEIVTNAPAPLLDIDELRGDVWDLLPMSKYRAHNWQGFGNLGARQPYASIYTSLGCPYKCLAGDAEVNTIYGKFPIRALAECFGDRGVPVYTYDPLTRRVSISDAVNIRRYGQGERLVRVRFDDGTHLDCTPDHKFLQFKWGNGKSEGAQWECEAKDLVPGAHVRAIRLERHPTGRIVVAWGRRDRQHRSRMVMEYLLERRLDRKEPVHHGPLGTSIDHPSNLDACDSAADHFRRHPEIAARMRTNNPAAGGLSQQWRDRIGDAVRGKVRSEEARRRYRESKLEEKNPNFRHGRRAGIFSRLAEVNHRVVGVEFLDAPGDVYCLTVPATGWFFANDVLVKNCSFCCINAPFRSNRYRMRNPKDVVAEIIYLRQTYGIQTFKIVDEMFVLNEAHYTAICEGLIERMAPFGQVARYDKEIPTGDVPLNIWAYARVDTVRPDKLKLLRRAGIRWLALGIESASAYVRDGASKRLKNDDIAGVVRAIQDAGINVIGNYIFGLPDDDEASMQATLDLAIDLRTEFANFYSAMAYPGSQLYRDAIQENWTLPESWRGYSQHNDDCRPLDTRYVPAAMVLKFRDYAFNAYFSDPGYLAFVEKKFGVETAAHVRQMTSFKLKRKLLAAA